MVRITLELTVLANFCGLRYGTGILTSESSVLTYGYIRTIVADVRVQSFVIVWTHSNSS